MREPPTSTVVRLGEASAVIIDGRLVRYARSQRSGGIKERER
jgi:hypothetical protein